MREPNQKNIFKINEVMRDMDEVFRINEVTKPNTVTRVKLLNEFQFGSYIC